MAVTRWQVALASPRAAIGALWESALEWAARMQHGERDPRVRELCAAEDAEERETARFGELDRRAEPRVDREWKQPDWSDE